MNTIKYDYRHFDKHTFRIRMEKFNDTTFGIVVRYEIQEPADIPCHWWERLKQFFTVSCYHYGYWIPSCSNDTLEQRIIDAMAYVAKEWDTQNKAEKEWEAL